MEVYKSQGRIRACNMESFNCSSTGVTVSVYKEKKRTPAGGTHCTVPAFYLCASHKVFTAKENGGSKVRDWTQHNPGHHDNKRSMHGGPILHTGQPSRSQNKPRFRVCLLRGPPTRTRGHDEDRGYRCNYSHRSVHACMLEIDRSIEPMHALISDRAI